MTLRHCMAIALVATIAGAGSQWEAMDLIISEANAEICDHDYSNATAEIRVQEKNNGTTKVTLRIRGAKPSHIHTVWLKLAGPSPLTGAGATPAAPTSGIQTIIDNANSGSDAGANAFYTNPAGNATVHIVLDFHLSDGVYPFSQFDSEDADVDIGHAPFTFRVISHCTDDEQHGLTPGVHEPTFQVSLDD